MTFDTDSRSIDLTLIMASSLAQFKPSSRLNMYSPKALCEQVVVRHILVYSHMVCDWQCFFFRLVFACLAFMHDLSCICSIKYCRSLLGKWASPWSNFPWFPSFDVTRLLCSLCVWLGVWRARHRTQATMYRIQTDQTTMSNFQHATVTLGLTIYCSHAMKLTSCSDDSLLNLFTYLSVNHCLTDFQCVFHLLAARR